MVSAVLNWVVHESRFHEVGMLDGFALSFGFDIQIWSLELIKAGDHEIIKVVVIPKGQARNCEADEHALYAANV